MLQKMDAINHKTFRPLKSLSEEDKDQQICYSCQGEEEIKHPSKKFSFSEVILERNMKYIQLNKSLITAIRTI